MLLNVFIVFGLLVHQSKGYTVSDEKTLRTSVFADYSNDIRPETPIDVTIAVSLMSLNYLDIGAQEMCANIVIVSSWIDSQLTWTPSAHNNITTMVVSYGTVWLPSIVIENTIDDTGLVGSDEGVPHRIESSGLITWISPAYARVSCSMKVTYFPFDEQTCYISLYGWAQDITEMNITYPSTGAWHLAEYKENGEWVLKDTFVREYLATDGYNTFKSLYFSATFKRRFTFLFLTLIVPAVLNALLMCAVFYLPFQDTDKLSYSLTVLLSYYVLLTLVADSLPPTSTNISILQLYLTFVMIIGTVSTLLSVFVVAIYNFEESRTITPWIRYFYYNMSSVIVCKKVTCKKISSNLCLACRDRRKKTKVHSNNTAEESCGYDNSGASIRSSSLESSAQSNNRPQTTTTLVSKRGSKTSHQSEIKSEQRGTTVIKFNKDSKKDELPTNTAEASNVTNSAMPANDKSSKNNDANFNDKMTPKYDGEAIIMFNQTPRQISNNKCDDCGEQEAGNVKETEEEGKELTWQMVAKRMDAVFLRIIGGIICVVTFILMVIFIAQY